MATTCSRTSPINYVMISNLGALSSFTAAISVLSSNSDECTATVLSTGSPNPCQAIAVGSSNRDECTATVLSTGSPNPCQAISVLSSNSDECTATILSPGSPNPCQALLSLYLFIKMPDCTCCDEPLPEGNCDFVTCSICKLELHFECADVKESTWNRMGEDRRKNWKCKPCQNKSKALKDQGYSKEVKDLITSLHSEFMEKMEKTIRLQFESYERKFSDQIKEFKSSVEYFSQKIDDYEQKIIEYSGKVVIFEKTQNDLKAENLSLKSELDACKLRLEDLEQYSRNKNLQIEGIPEQDNERMADIVGKISETINEEIDFDRDLQAIHRIPTKRAKGPNPIIIQFSNRKKRYSVLKKSKTAKLTSTIFSPNVPSVSVYVNEHLTQFNKNLLFQAKKLK
ncbi:hypothetical protein J6590_084967 [Homalodisca vitripennis]|nr:hypothetical protein J6590_084967 [Homalodisca vitripennis]